jgi:hypothetical protein
VQKSWYSFIWIAKIVVPMSLIISTLQWSGILEHISSFLDPVMKLINLPGEAALPILTGLLINVYSAIAVMGVLPFSIPQLTLISIFIMIAHNFILEGIIQQKSGINAFKVCFIRLVVAIMAVIIVSQFFGDNRIGFTVSSGASNLMPYSRMIMNWAIATFWLLLKIFFILLGVMLVLELLKATGAMKYLLRVFQPVMRLLGLSDTAAMLWITAAIFGLAYSAAVIVEECRQGKISVTELECLHISIGINHSIIEDPMLFLSLGINPVWLWIPKLLMAVVAVQLYRIFFYLKNILLPRTINK